MNWAQVKSLTIPEGVVSKVFTMDGTLWQKDEGFWKRALSGGEFNGVTFGDGLWVASSTTNAATSANGKKWSLTGLPLYGAVFLGGMWFATRYNNYPMYSMNGLTWTSCTGLSYTDSVEAYGAGVWVSAETSQGYGLKYSEDGKTFQTTTITDGRRSSLVYGGGVFNASIDQVYGGKFKGLYYSEDGKAWTKASTDCGSLAYLNGLWLGNSNSSVFVSEDGKTWTQGDAVNLRYFSYGNGIFIGLGSSSESSVYYSEDGKTWTQSNLSGSFRYAVFANGTWVIAGASGLYHSTDGKEWTTSNIVGKQARNVVYGDGLWLVNTYSFDSSGQSVVENYCSTDGMTWTETPAPGNEALKYAFADGLWVAADNGGLYWSDGLPEETA